MLTRPIARDARRLTRVTRISSPLASAIIATLIATIVIGFSNPVSASYIEGTILTGSLEHAGDVPPSSEPALVNAAASVAPVPIAPKYVQGSLGYTGNLVASQNATFGTRVTSGNLIVVAASTWNSSNTAVVASVADNYGNTYTKAVEDPSPATGNEEPLSIWYAANVKGGSNFTVTVKVVGSGSISSAIHEYSGVSATNPVDKVSHASGTSKVASSGMTTATTQANDLLFGASAFTNLTTLQPTAGSGFALRQVQPSNVCCNSLFTEDRTAASLSPYAATFGFPQVVSSRAAIVAFRAASSASTATTTPRPTSVVTGTPTTTRVATASPTPANSTSTPTPTNTRTVGPTGTATTQRTSVPTSTNVVPSPTAVSSNNSGSMGLWSPSPLDVCPSYPASVVTGLDRVNYIKAIHDSYKVKGPDGLWYPTWHPPVDPATGCRFGHEHGENPALANSFAQVRDHYAFVLPDGTKDIAESGIPFGYVNQQMDAWTVANGGTVPDRHEDHVGHKVSIANNFQIGLNSPTHPDQYFYAGVTCNYIVKVHQGTHSKDAFQNNLHEILYNVACSDGHTINLDSMGEFGAPGQFTRQCDAQNDRTTIVQTGFSYSDPNYPANPEGARGIIDRSCVETGILVTPGQFSANPYEAWPASISLKKANGTPVVDNLNLLFDVEDSIRYYYPGHVDPTAGTVDNLGHMQDLCYENFNGRTAHGGACDVSTSYGTVKGVTWDDPRAAFRGLNRGTYFKPGATHNAGGATVWYTDPFGGHAQSTPATGYLKQYVSLDTINYAASVGAFETGNVINLNHDDGHGTVHAPN